MKNKRIINIFARNIMYNFNSINNIFTNYRGQGMLGKRRFKINL